MIPILVAAFPYACLYITPELSCVAHLRARTRHAVSIAVTHPMPPRAPLQVCHVSYSDLLDRCSLHRGTQCLVYISHSKWLYFVFFAY